MKTTKKPGRPRKENPKEHFSIRLERPVRDQLVAKYGSLQKAIEHLIKASTLAALVILAACNASSGSPEVSSAAQSCAPALASWVDDGGLGIDLTGLEMGQTITVDKLAGDLDPLSVNPDELCTMAVAVSGDDCSGTIAVIDSEEKAQTPGHLTTACVDLEGVYEYQYSNGNFIFGREGSAPIGYH